MKATAYFHKILFFLSIAISGFPFRVQSGIWSFNTDLTLEVHGNQQVPLWVELDYEPLHIPHDLPHDGLTITATTHCEWSFHRELGDSPEPPRLWVAEYVLLHDVTRDDYSVITVAGRARNYWRLYAYTTGGSSYTDYFPPDSTLCIIDSSATLRGAFVTWTPDRGMGNPTFEPGSYTIRFGFTGSAYATTDPESIFVALEHDPYATYRDHNFQVDAVWQPGANDEQITFENATAWKSWLPEARLTSKDSTHEIILKFKFLTDDPNKEYRLRGRFWQDSWYPGSWTNDYGNTDGGTSFPKETRTVAPPWVVSLSYLWPHTSEERKAADFAIPITSTKNKDWVTHTRLREDGEKGWTELLYNKKIKGVNSFELTLESNDFGATGRLCLGVQEYNGDTTRWSESDFYALPLYQTTYTMQPGNRDTTVWLRNLPIPCDLEATWLTFPDSIKGSPDRILTVVGDRIGDYWETGDAGFSSIYECDPYADNSNEDQSFYPFNTDIDVKQAGDGLTNLERYRGFYGLMDTQNNLYHKRLPGKERAIFTVSINEEKYPSIYARPNTIQYFDAISGSASLQTNINNYRLMKNKIDIIDSTDINEHYYHRSAIFKYNKTILNSNFYNHKLFINNLLIGMHSQKELVATYCYNAIDTLIEVNDFYRDYNNVYADTTDNYDYLTEHTLGVVYNNNDNNTPWDTEFSFTFLNSIRRGVFQMGVADTLSAILLNQSKVFGHEMGHFVGMTHDHAILSSSIMKQGVFLNPPSRYKKRNYRHFRLSR